MRPFTLKAAIKAVDQGASKVFDKVTRSAQKMANSIFKNSTLANTAFRRFSQKVGFAVQKASIHLNNLNARVNQTFRGIKKKLGKIGTLGLSIGFAAIAGVILRANIELDSSFASLSAITGKTGKQFEFFKSQVNKVAKEQTLFGADVAKGFEIVASAQPILLDNAKALGKVTNAAITLSKASGDDLAGSALSLTGVMNQFNLEAEQAERTMNALAAGSVAGSANITNVAASMKNFGAVANSANLSVEQSIALVEVMGSKAIFAEDAGNKLKASVLNLQAAGVGYSSGAFNMADALKEVKKRVDAARTAKEKDKIVTDIFKKTGIATGQILLNNIDMYEQMTKSVTGTTTATDQMNIKANTFQNRLDEIVASFKNSITATDEQSVQMQQLKDAMGWVAENMGSIISGIIIALKIFAAYKIIMTAATIVTWAFNSALLANPITWIIIGIVALIAAIAALIIYWEDIVNWVKTSNNIFAKLIRFALTPLMMLFKAIGAVIDWVSGKISQLVEWVKTSDSGFAKFIRGSINSIIQLFQMIGDVIDWLGQKWDNLTNWITTSDSGFAKFIRGAVEPLIALFQKLGQIWDDLVGGSNKLTLEQRGIDVNNLTPEQMGISSKLQVETKKEDKLAKELEKNTIELDRNTKSNKKEWTGRFSTTILRDLNVNDRAMQTTQKELAISAISNETINKEIQNSIFRNKDISNIISNQESVDKSVMTNNSMSTEFVTESKSKRTGSNQNVNGNITIEVIDRTNSKFGIQVKGTGIEVTTTGNK